MKLLIGLSTTLFAIIFGSAFCEEPQEMKSESGIMVPAVPKPLSRQTIVEIVENNPDLRIFYSAILAANLDGTFSAPGPFTVFAPTNAAFAKLPAGTVDNLMKPENKERLRSLLMYHVLPGKLLPTDLKTGKAGTISGKLLEVRNVGGGLQINHGKVIKKEIIGGNGVIYIMDTVLIP